MSSNRASLLSGLRTGGPRSASSGQYMPQTAAPGAQFSISKPSQYTMFERDFPDASGVPMTAPAQDATLAHLQHQQQAQLLLLQAQALQKSTVPNSAAFGYQQQGLTMEQQQALQLQLEVYKMQAMHQQQQQLQAQVMQEVQRQMIMQQSAQQATRRRPSEPATASPYTSSFAAGQKVRNATDGSMTAGVEGRFPSKLNPLAASFTIPGSEPATNASSNNATWRAPGVLSGGTSLGMTSPPAAASPAKHNTATSWRRASTVVKPTLDRDISRTPSPSSSITSSPPPTVYVTTPEETSPTTSTSRSISPPTVPAFTGTRSKPTLTLSGGTASREHLLELDSGLPLSPLSPTGSFMPPQSPVREEAARRLYEGLGFGRASPPAPAPVAEVPVRQPQVQVSHVTRQPVGPPSEVESLGERNFASRSEAARARKMNLNVLAGARNRRMSAMIEVEAY